MVRDLQEKKLLQAGIALLAAALVEEREAAQADVARDLMRGMAARTRVIAAVGESGVAKARRGWRIAPPLPPVASRTSLLQGSA